MGECLKMCEGTFCLKMVDSTAISGQIILILILNQFYQRRKMRLELTHPRKFSAKLTNIFLKLQLFKARSIANFANGSS